jgi:hypothetical protein
LRRSAAAACPGEKISSTPRVASYGFDAAVAAQVPGGVKEFVEGDGLDCTLRVEFLDQGLLEVLELLVFIVVHDEVFAGEAVTDGVARNAGLALRSDGSGGVLRVRRIGSDLSQSRHILAGR